MDLGLNTKIKTQETIQGLNIYLANLLVLYTKLHNFHWNIVGVNFFDFHMKLQGMYEFIAEEIDRVAERILMLGYKPVANLESALRLATICEMPSIDFAAPIIAHGIICDFIVIVNQIRKLAEIAGQNYDEYTIVLLSEAIGFYEKNIWMFRAYLTHGR